MLYQPATHPAADPAPPLQDGPTSRVADRSWRPCSINAGRLVRTPSRVRPRERGSRASRPQGRVRLRVAINVPLCIARRHLRRGAHCHTVPSTAMPHPTPRIEVSRAFAGCIVDVPILRAGCQSIRVEARDLLTVVTRASGTIDPEVVPWHPANRKPRTALKCGRCSAQPVF